MPSLTRRHAAFTLLATVAGVPLATFPAPAQAQGQPVTTPSGLKFTDSVVGTGDTLRAARITLAADGGAGPTDGSVRIAGKLEANGMVTRPA